jgi:omega-6 fatty acid desaturase (delta-12 desaturase)
VLVPNFQLQQCHDANAVFQRSSTIAVRSGTAALRLTLWDEGQHRLVRFRDVTIT